MIADTIRAKKGNRRFKHFAYQVSLTDWHGIEGLRRPHRKATTLLRHGYLQFVSGKARLARKALCIDKLDAALKELLTARKQ